MTGDCRESTTKLHSITHKLVMDDLERKPTCLPKCEWTGTVTCFRKDDTEVANALRKKCSIPPTFQKMQFEPPQTVASPFTLRQLLKTVAGSKLRCRSGAGSRLIRVKPRPGSISTTKTQRQMVGTEGGASQVFSRLPWPPRDQQELNTDVHIIN